MFQLPTHSSSCFQVRQRRAFDSSRRGHSSRKDGLGWWRRSSVLAHGRWCRGNPSGGPQGEAKAEATQKAQKEPKEDSAYAENVFSGPTWLPPAEAQAQKSPPSFCHG